MPIQPDDTMLDPNLAEDHGDVRRVAYGYVEDAFNEAQQDGLDPDAMAHAALFAALRTLVEVRTARERNATYRDRLDRLGPSLRALKLRKAPSEVLREDRDRA